MKLSKRIESRKNTGVALDIGEAEFTLEADHKDTLSFDLEPQCFRIYTRHA